MKITLNEQPHTCPDNSRVVDIIQAEYGERAGIAVALNGDVVSRSQWSETRISENDRLDIFHAVAGG